MQSEQTNELAKSLASAQGMMKAAKFNKQNPHFKNKYADLAAVWDAIREPLSKNGLSVTQTMQTNGADHELWLVTTLRHASGQWTESMYPLPPNAKPQEFGSALTYARRYSLSAIVGIASEEDDDANEAQKVEPKPRPPTINDGVGKPLSDQQTEQLMLYAGELDTDRITKFLAWLNVKSLDDIKAHQYERAMAGLKKAVGSNLGSTQAPGESAA